MKACVAIVIGCLLFGACDSGDGKTLREPTGTLPPPTVPTTTGPPAELLPDDVGTVASLPLDSTNDQATLPAPVAGEFRMIAPWLDGDEIDPRHTCDGVGDAPALSWADVPAGTVELAVTVVDTSATEMPLVHWVIAGINPNDISLIEATVPLGAIQATNSFDSIGFAPPCPDAGAGASEYRFTIHALNQQVELADGTPTEILLDFVQTVSIASADVIGTYER